MEETKNEAITTTEEEKKSLAKSDQEALEQVKTDYTAAKAITSSDFTRFAEYYKLFRNQQVEKNYTGLANLFVPEPYRIVRKKSAKLSNAIKSIKVVPETQNDIESAKNSTHLLNFLRRKLNWFITERSAIQESRITGLSWIKIVWNLSKEETDKPWKGFDMKMQAADSVYLAPDTTMNSVFEGTVPWLIHEYETDFESLEKNGNYNKEALKVLKEKGNSSLQKTPLSQARLMNQRGNSDKSGSGSKTKYSIQERWGMYKGQNWLIVIANSTVTLRNEKNPYSEILGNYLPFVPICGDIVGKEMYPVGDIEPSKSLFNELNDTRNQRMDTVTLNIDPPKEIIRAANIDEKELVPRRGWMYHSTIPNGVRFIPPDMQGVIAAINEEKIIRSDIQQTTNSLDFTSGSDVQGGLSIDTARGAIIAKGEADVVTEDELEILKVSLRLLYRIVLAYSQKFLDRQFQIRLLEKGQESFVDISSAVIQGNLDTDIEMRTLQDKTIDQQIKLMVFNQAKTVPGAKLGKFFMDVLESLYGDINIDEYYQEPQPVQETPKISISLKGDLNSSEADEIYKTIPGVDPAAADPILREDLREAMRGNLPEHKVNIEKNVNIETPDIQPGIPVKSL